MRRHSRLLALAVLLALVLSSLLPPSTVQAETINDIEFGKQIAGDRFNARAMRGKAVLLAYWNANLATAGKTLNDVIELRKEMPKEHVYIVVYQDYEMDEALILQKWKALGGEESGMPLIYGLKIPKKLTQSKTPSAVIAPSGEIVMAANDKQVAQKLRELAMRLPGYIPGTRDYKRLSSLAKKLERTDRSIAGSIKQLQRIAAGEDKGQNSEEAIEEAKFMLDRLQTWVNTEKTLMDKSLTSNPIPAAKIAADMSKTLSGSDLGEPFEEVNTKFRRDREYRDQIKAAEIWQSILPVMERNKLGPRSQANAFEKLKDKETGQYSRDARQIINAVVGLIKKYPDTWAGQQADVFATNVGLKK